jgi:IclR family acetate operon transcriptional repressor
MSQDRKPVLAIVKAFRLLDILSEARTPLSLAELSARSGWPKSTVYGLLVTMRKSAVIEQLADSRYFLGIRLFEYGCSVSGCWSISEIAHPFLQHLAETVGESVFLSILSRTETVTIDQARSREGLRVVSDLGTRLPLHCTSQGKIFLAAMEEQDVTRILSQNPPLAFTPHTLTNQDELREDLNTVRRQGFAIEDGEYKIGLRSVSAPIRDVSGQIKYAVGVVGMFRRIQSPEFQRIIELTTETAAQISAAIGYRAAPGR